MSVNYSDYLQFNVYHAAQKSQRQFFDLIYTNDILIKITKIVITLIITLTVSDVIIINLIIN